jgi:hypothetical protein
VGTDSAGKPRTWIARIDARAARASSCRRSTVKATAGVAAHDLPDEAGPEDLDTMPRLEQSSAG